MTTACTEAPDVNKRKWQIVTHIPGVVIVMHSPGRSGKASHLEDEGRGMGTSVQESHTWSHRDLGRPGAELRGLEEISQKYGILKEGISGRGAQTEDLPNGEQPEKDTGSFTGLGHSTVRQGTARRAKALESTQTSVQMSKLLMF